MLNNALRDVKTKMLNFQYKNSCKGHHRSNLHWHYIKNLASLGLQFMWKFSYLYQKVHTKPPFWAYATLLGVRLKEWKTHKPLHFVLSYVLPVTQQYMSKEQHEKHLCNLSSHCRKYGEYTHERYSYNTSISAMSNSFHNILSNA